MSLTKLFGKNIQTLALGAALTTACGDTYYNTYDMGEEEYETGSESGINIKDCNDVAERLYECDPKHFEKYKEAWDVSIEDQLKHVVNECENVKFFERAPLWIDCIEQNSCEAIRDEVCDEYMVNY